MVFIENWIFISKTIKLDYSLSSCTQKNSKWIKDLNVRSETIKLLEENISSKLFDICLRQYFFGYVSSGKGNKNENEHMGLHQTKKLFHIEENYQPNKKVT